MLRKFKLAPLHGWRAFFGEIAIIVIGVLVALAAQQWVENWSWTRKIADAERQLHRESRTNSQYAVEMVTVEPCVDAQLDALRRRVLASGATLDPAPVFRDKTSTFVFRQPSRPYLNDAWQALSEDGTTSHLDPWRRSLMARLYSQIPNLVGDHRQSGMTAGRMMLMAEAIPLGPDTRARLLQDIAEQRDRIRSQALVALQTLASIRDLGQITQPQRLDRFLANQSGTARFCRAHRLPLANWRTELARETVRKPGDEED